jgi:hypothetical protein
MTSLNFVLLKGKKDFQEYNKAISQQELNDGLQFVCSCLTEKNQFLLALLQVTNQRRLDISRNPFEKSLTHIFNRLRSSIRSQNSDIRNGQLIVNCSENGRQILELTDGLRVSATDGSDEINFVIGRSALQLTLVFRAESKPVAINYIGHARGRKGAPTTLRKQVEYVLSIVSKLELLREQLELVNKDVDEDDFTATSQPAQSPAEDVLIRDDVQADDPESMLSGAGTFFGFEQLRIKAQAWIDKQIKSWKSRSKSKRLQILAALFEGAMWALIYRQIIGGNFNSKAWIPFALVTAAIALSKSDVVTLERSSQWFLATGGALFVVPSITLWVLNSSNNMTKVVPLWMIVAVFQIRLTWSLSRRYLAAVDNSLKGYFDNESWFEDDKTAGAGTRNRDRYEKLLRRANETGFSYEAEGQSQLFLLIRMVFGVATSSSIVVSYFQIGQIYQQSADNLNNFIFENNEGFTAALSLLIVVLTTAAVQTYSYLVAQIRQEDDRFERAVSSLKQALMNVDSHMKRVWEHLSATVPEDKREIDQRLCDLLNNQQEGNSYINVLERYCSRPTAELQDGLQPSRARLSAWQEIGYVDSDASRVGDSSVREGWRRWHSLELSRSGPIRQPDLKKFLQRPPDEKSLYLILNLAHSENEVPAWAEAFTRLLVRVNRHRQHWMDDNVLQFCNELDLDATYFVDDLSYFDQIFSSIQGYVSPGDNHLSSSTSKKPSLAKDIRAGEVARALSFFAWFTFLQNLRINEIQKSAEQAALPLDSYISEFFFSQVIAATGLDDPDNHEARLLLMLSAAQRTQLHNLIRSALASQRRTLLSQFEDALDDYRAPRHFAIPVLPKFSDRISHLQFFLGISRKSQRPIRLTPNMDVIERELEDTDIRPMFAVAHQLRYVTVDRERAVELYQVKTKWDRVISELGFTPDWTRAAQISAQTWSDLSTDPPAPERNGVGIDETSWTDYPPRWRLAVMNWFQDRTFQFNTQVASATDEDLGGWKVVNRSFWLVLKACAPEVDGIEFTSEPDQKPSTTDVNHIISIVIQESEENLIQQTRMFCRNANHQRKIGERLFPGKGSQIRMDAFLGRIPQ